MKKRINMNLFGKLIRKAKLSKQLSSDMKVDRRAFNTKVKIAKYNPSNIIVKM